MVEGNREWAESELIAVSALAHWSYCPRRCALIHLEQTFEENLYTLRGQRVHRVADEPDIGTTRGVRVARAVPIWSTRLGLTGRADVIEFPAETPYPIEYKSGSRTRWGSEHLQLCAQAICLEEMFDVAVPAGAVWYRGSRQQVEVVFDPVMRRQVETATAEIRAMLTGTRLPAAVNDKRCPNCSLVDTCLPALAASPARIRGFQVELFRPGDE